MYRYTDMRGRQGGDSNEWKIPSRLSYLFHSRLLTPHSPLMYSAISRDGGLCVRLSVSLPSHKTRTALNAQADGTERARHISQTRCNCKCLSLGQDGHTHAHTQAENCQRKSSKVHSLGLKCKTFPESWHHFSTTDSTKSLRWNKRALWRLLFSLWGHVSLLERHGQILGFGWKFGLVWSVNVLTCCDKCLKRVKEWITMYLLQCTELQRNED